MTEARKVKGMSLPVYSRFHATKNNQSIKQLSRAYKLIAVLFAFFISLLSMPSWAVGTVDSAELVPVVATVLPDSNQRFDFNAQNTKTDVLASYTVKLAYSNGLNVSNLVVTPVAKSAKIDVRKQVITIQWTKVAVGATVSASWDTSSAIDGVYTFSDAGLVYKVGRTNYTGTVNSASLTVVTDTNPPDIPAGLSTIASDAQVSLNWLANSEIDLAGYNVHRATTMAGPYTQLTTDFLVSTSYIDTAVSNGTLYYYVITAVDVVGNISAYSTEVSAKPFDIIAPDAPTGLTATVGDALVNLGWTTNNEIDLAGYDVYRAEVTGGPYTKLTSTSLTTTNYTDTTVTNGIPYFYVITAKDTSGNVSAYSAEVNANPVDTTAPQISQVNITNIVSDSVSINWITNEPATSQVEYGTTNTYGQSSLVNTNLTQNHSVTLTGLINGTVYHYRVLSQDAVNNLASSVDHTFIAGQNQLPIANPGGPYSGQPNNTIMFDGSASFDPEGANLIYRWDFGDGSIATGIQPTHAYNSSGTYTVRLIVNDGVQDSTWVSTSVTISKPIVYLSGNIGGTLTADNQYIVTGNISAGSLIIEPGVEIRFPQDGSQYSLTVSSSLTAIGTAELPIRFTADSGQGCSSNNWYGIKNGSASTSITVDNAIIECAYRGFWLSNSSGSGSITNSLIQKNYRGIFTTFDTYSTNRTRTTIQGNTLKSNTTDILVYGRSSPQIKNNMIQGTILLQASPTYSAYPTPLIQGNSVGRISLSSYDSGLNVAIDATGNWWGTTSTSSIRGRITDRVDNASLPYVNFGAFLDGPNGQPVNSNYLYAIQQDTVLNTDTEYMAINLLTVPDGITLTVNPGASLTFPGNEKLSVNGSLLVQGTASNPARFSNGQSIRRSNSWRGIEVRSSATVSIDNAVIVDAYIGVNFSNANGTVSNSHIQGNTTGVYVYGNASPVISNNVIKFNNHGLDVRGLSSTSGSNPAPLVNNNSLHNNFTYNYYVINFFNADTVTLNASNNWWGTTDTALIEQAIYDATEAPLTSPIVNYTPYLDVSPIDETITAPVLNTAATLVGVSPYPLTGSAPAGSTVQIYVNNILTTRTSAAADGSFSIDVPLSEGLNTIHATSILIIEESDVSNTLSVTLDTITPTIDVSLVSVSDVISGQVNVIGIAAATEGNTLVKLTNPDNSASATTIANADGSFSFTLAASPADSLIIYSVDEIGNQSPARVLLVPGTPPPLSLEITAPATGSMVTTETIVVSGTLTAPGNSGVTVNGIVAEIIENKFYAKDVLLQAGDNIIAATVKTIDGQTTSSSITVTYTPPAEPVLVTLTASPDTGIAALNVTFSVATESNITISQIDLDVDGDDIADITTTDFSVPLTYTYAAPGAYTAKVFILDSLGNTHTATTTVIVQAITRIRNNLEAVYYTMLERLRVGDIDGAMQFITAGVSDKYRDIFTTIHPSLVSIVDDLGTLDSSTIGADFAEFAIVRNENGEKRAYLIYLIRGEDGVWRIDGM